MNRRPFLGLLGSLPFLGWLKPKAAPEPTLPGWNDPIEHVWTSTLYGPQYPLPDWTNPWPGAPPTRAEYYERPYDGPRKNPYMMVKPMSWTDEEIMQRAPYPAGTYRFGPCISSIFGDHSDCADGCPLK